MCEEEEEGEMVHEWVFKCHSRSKGGRSVM